MEAYVAMARIRTAHPRPRRAVGERDASAPQGGDPGPIVERPVELVGRPFDERIADWWASFSVNLAQTTFFLTDPDSWR
jgi:hypothetical protein